MENAVYLGVYEALPVAQRLKIDASPSGRWQAWKLAEGELSVQALDTDGMGCGSLEQISERVFSKVFMPVAELYTQEATLGGMHLGMGKIVDATAPDLLHIWRRRMLGLPVTSQQPTDLAKDAAVSTFFVSTGQVDSQLDNAQDAAKRCTSPQKNLVEDSAIAQALTEHADSIGESFSEEQLRRDFSEVLDMLRSGARQMAQEGIAELVRREGLSAERAKYAFSEFGLVLRREKQYEAALQCHLRAFAVAQDDEHVLFNLARTEYELGRTEQARKYLRKALDVTPDFSAALNFMEFLDSV